MMIAADQAGDFFSHPLTVVVVGALAVAVIGGIAKLLTNLVQHMARAADVLDKLEERVLIHFEVAGPGERDESVPAQLQYVKDQLSVNGGQSVKDVLAQVRRLVENHGPRLDRLEGREGEGA